jgi:hypothetical protein
VLAFAIARVLAFAIAGPGVLAFCLLGVLAFAIASLRVLANVIALRVLAFAPVTLGVLAFAGGWRTTLYGNGFVQYWRSLAWLCRSNNNHDCKVRAALNKQQGCSEHLQPK